MILGLVNGKGELPICFETKDSVTLPFCDHTICFKKCFSYQDEEDQPKFPYSEEIWKKYDDIKTDDLELFQKYPLLKQYEIDLEEWEDRQAKKYENTENLSK